MLQAQSVTSYQTTCHLKILIIHKTSIATAMPFSQSMISEESQSIKSNGQLLDTNTAPESREIQMETGRKMKMYEGRLYSTPWFWLCDMKSEASHIIAKNLFISAAYQNPFL